MNTNRRKDALRQMRSWKRVMYTGLLLSALLFAISACGGASQSSNPAADAASKGSPPPGVQTFGTLSRDHTELPVTYSQTPPVGEPHSPVWQNCGFYDKPIGNEHGVHSMEHGAVWITYRPDLPTDQVAILKKEAQQTYVLMSPYPNLPAPVLASAWSTQLKLDSATDPRLDQLVKYYREGLQTQEPGAPCTGGTSTTQ